MIYTYIYTYKVHQSTIKVESFLQQRNQEPMDLTNMALSPPLLGSAAAQFIPKVLQVFLMRACLVASNFLLHTSKPQKSTQQGCQPAHSILIEFIHIKGSRVVALNHHFQVCFVSYTQKNTSSPSHPSILQNPRGLTGEVFGSKIPPGTFNSRILNSNCSALCNCAFSTLCCAKAFASARPEIQLRI